MLKVYYSNEQSKFNCDVAMRNLVRRAILAALKYENVDYDTEISVVFTDNDGIRELNKEYRNIDRATDVLSFPLIDFRNGETSIDGETAELGDIVLSLERAEEQSKEFGHSLKREISFLTVHSVLHLLGYDHEISEEEEKLMFGKQEEIMKILKLTRESQ